jgi:hypothetical protein
MNRVTRFTSAAFGMLMLAGLAYYQGHDDPLSGEQGSLTGTAVAKQVEHQKIDCENLTDLNETDREYCENKEPPGEPN